MHRSLRFLAALLIAAVASPALATNGMRMTGFGAVQNGMGGVGTALTLDTSTLVSNPAGLSDLARRLDVSVTWFVPTVDYTVSAPYASGTTQSSNKGGSAIPTVGLALPLNDAFSLGLGVFGVAGMGVDYDADLFGSPLKTAYQQLRVAPAVSWKSGGFSLGLAVNLAYAQMSYDAASAMGNPNHDTTSSFGYGATIGLKFAPTKTVALGLSYETETSFQDFSFDLGAAGTDKLKFNQPAVLAGGVAWQPMPELALAFDVEWIQWSATNGLNQPAYTSGPSSPGGFNMNWSDQVVFKVGAEYAVTPAWKVRAGYNYGKQPLDKSRVFENVAFPAIAEQHISLGLGWNATKDVAINLAGTYSPKSTLTGSGVVNPTPGAPLADYSTSMSQYAIDLGVGWKF